MRRRLALVAVLALVAGCPPSHAPVVPPPPAARFVHPRARVVLAGLRGADVPVQAWVEPHPADRLLQLEYARAGEAPVVLFAQTVDGAQPRLFPAEGWVTARLGHGTWTIAVLACTEHAHARCTRVRLRHETTVTVCGGDSC